MHCMWGQCACLLGKLSDHHVDGFKTGLALRDCGPVRVYSICRDMSFRAISPMIFHGRPGPAAATPDKGQVGAEQASHTDTLGLRVLCARIMYYLGSSEDRVLGPTFLPRVMPHVLCLLA